MNITTVKLAEIVNGVWEELLSAAKEDNREKALLLLVRILNRVRAFENPAVLLRPYFGQAFIVQPIKDISWIEGDSCYCWIYRVNGTPNKYKVYGYLKDFDVFFALFQFQRVHKSHLLHLPHIVEVGNQYSYADMDHIWKPSISEMYKSEFEDIYKRFRRGKNFT